MNYYYRNTISNFLQKNTDEIIGSITRANEFDVTFFQNKSWELQIPIVKNALQNFEGEIFFEFSIPRMGKRVDTLIIIKNIVFVIEFKVGESHFLNSNIEQVWDYISPQINRAEKNKSYFYNCYGKEEKFYIENQG